MKSFQPREDWHHIRLVDPAQRSAGGVWLPELSRENWTQGEVLASGPGFRLPESGVPMSNQADAGFEVLFQRSSYIEFSDNVREGMVRDRDLVAVIGLDKDENGFKEGIYPLNDWVALSLEGSQEFHGNIAIPDEWQRRPLRGRVLNYGSGRLITGRTNTGYFSDVCSIIGLSPDTPLEGAIVYWSADADCLEVYRDDVECLLVRAQDLLCIAEEVLVEQKSAGGAGRAKVCR